MWPTMNVSQLNRQREIMLDHVTKVQSMVDTNASVSVRNMFGALQVGLEDLNKLIDAKYAEKQKL